MHLIFKENKERTNPLPCFPNKEELDRLLADDNAHRECRLREFRNIFPKVLCVMVNGYVCGRNPNRMTSLIHYYHP